MKRLCLLTLCALILSAVGPVRQVSAFPLGLSGNGSGTVTPAACTSSCTLSAGILGKFIGKSTMTLAITVGTALGSGGGPACSTATATGTINTANKSAITIQTVGTICDVGDNALTYNASYFLSGGSPHFPGAAGAGLFVASIDQSGNALVTLSGGFIK